MSFVHIDIYSSFKFKKFHPSLHMHTWKTTKRNRDYWVQKRRCWNSIGWECRTLCKWSCAEWNVSNPFLHAQLRWQTSILSTSMHFRKMSHRNISDINLPEGRAINGLVDKKIGRGAWTFPMLHCVANTFLLSCECCSFFLTSWLRHFHLHGDQSKQRDLTSYWHTYCICIVSLRERT